MTIQKIFVKILVKKNHYTSEKEVFSHLPSPISLSTPGSLKKKKGQGHNFFFFLLSWGCPGQLARTTTIPHGPLNILQAQWADKVPRGW
jgi:hypothetical protein